MSHSFSKKYFSEKFKKENIADTSYELFELENITLLPDLLDQQPTLKGFNVTIPYKKEILPFLNEIDPSAAKVGAVNVVKVKSDGTMHGYNSDYYGFKISLENWCPVKPQALVLGTGGAADAVCAVLKELNLKFNKVSRQKTKGGYTYEELINRPEIMDIYKLVVNTTPLGMYPDENSKPNLPYEALTPKHYLYDLVYNPEITAFMKSGMDSGANVKNGLEMLELQAERSWEIWNT